MNTFSGVALSHLKRYPLMEVQDLYKLAYQAALGAEHAAANPDFVHLRLMQELGGLREGLQEPLADPISPDGRILRVHLRPFIQAAGDPLKLSRAFWESSRAFHGTLELLALFWLEARHLAEAGEIPFKPNELKQYYSDRQAAKFQPVHHSVAYREAYQPAYRVILMDYWQD